MKPINDTAIVIIEPKRQDQSNFIRFLIKRNIRPIIFSKNSSHWTKDYKSVIAIDIDCSYSNRVILHLRKTFQGLVKGVVAGSELYIECANAVAKSVGIKIPYPNILGYHQIFNKLHCAAIPLAKFKTINCYKSIDKATNDWDKSSVTIHDSENQINIKTTANNIKRKVLEHLGSELHEKRNQSKFPILIQEWLDGKEINIIGVKTEDKILALASSETTYKKENAFKIKQIDLSPLKEKCSGTVLNRLTKDILSSLSHEKGIWNIAATLTQKDELVINKVSFTLPKDPIIFAIESLSRVNLYSFITDPVPEFSFESNTGLYESIRIQFLSGPTASYKTGCQWISEAQKKDGYLGGAINMPSYRKPKVKSSLAYAIFGAFRNTK